MEDKVLQPLAWISSLLLFAMLLYMGKSALGIDLVSNCHANEVIFGTCKSAQAENQISKININFK